MAGNLSGYRDFASLTGKLTSSKNNSSGHILLFIINCSIQYVMCVCIGIFNALRPLSTLCAVKPIALELTVVAVAVAVAVTMVIEMVVREHMCIFR